MSEANASSEKAALLALLEKTKSKVVNAKID